MSGTAVDHKELDKFASLALRWWDQSGPMRPLHKLNPLRLDYILERLHRHLGRQRGDRRALAGLDILDVGCGGGLLAEPLARLGGRVTGIDPEMACVDAARWHAQRMGLDIAYHAMTIEDLVAMGRDFDLVLAMEVIEHVPDAASFTRSLARAVRPGGVLVLATLSRTMRSYALAIVGAEYVLGWLPRGTHRWRRFVKPSELAGHLRHAGLLPEDVTGVAYDAAHDRFELVRDPSVNYMACALRRR